ncbi:DNA-3-methyladenine glycosylase [Marivirga harenae]|uniref:DNA-3-methyladenine glycosylase n=1 Tax=Marivirga harenae TaxID=2010992 RepID=UPI0026DF254E|nr:DNA-3-methyladenine glycosylase [Marivirga harenae]WKV11180.1 DNA-3-methyladenine glycosylase [Marivirga harenae]|tara:strand:+ start:52090 stop:52698 length:609 start_codon:yes stop_codon:yes gene_type:complete
MKVTKKRLGRTFFTNPDVVGVAQALLGKVICSNIDGIYCEAMITETEAYSGLMDKACHAHLGKFTKRSSTMYQEGGTAYIYLCYGIHNLLNIVTNNAGKADAVLIRAIEPIRGTNIMMERRNTDKITPLAFSGPGKLCKALAIDKSYNGVDLVNNDDLFIAEGNNSIDKIVKTTRIGIDYAEEDALLPWRFYIYGNKFISQP